MVISLLSATVIVGQGGAGPTTSPYVQILTKRNDVTI